MSWYHFYFNLCPFHYPFSLTLTLILTLTLQKIKVLFDFGCGIIHGYHYILSFWRFFSCDYFFFLISVVWISNYMREILFWIHKLHSNILRANIFESNLEWSFAECNTRWDLSQSAILIEIGLYFSLKLRLCSVG